LADAQEEAVRAEFLREFPSDKFSMTFDRARGKGSLLCTPTQTVMPPDFVEKLEAVAILLRLKVADFLSH
jgi:hypothetical protein